MFERPNRTEPPVRLQFLAYLKMFSCEVCHQVVPQRTAARSIVWETRSKTYPKRKDVFQLYELKLRAGLSPDGVPCLRGIKVRKRGPKKDAARERSRSRDPESKETPSTHDPGGTGREIVRELRVCPACALRFDRAQSNPQRSA